MMKQVALCLWAFCLMGLVFPSFDNEAFARTPEEFCASLEMGLVNSKQEVSAEIAHLCMAAMPTQLFISLLQFPLRDAEQRVSQVSLNQILNNPGDINPDRAAYVRIESDDNAGDGKVRLTVAYAMRVGKSAVPLLLAEETYAKKPPFDDNGFSISYDEEGFSNSFKFDVPPKNDGDCETAFRVTQFTKNTENVEFEDYSSHDLKFYRLSNVDYTMFLAARTLVEASEQFTESKVVRGFLTDAADPNYTNSITVISLLMNGRDNEDNVLDLVNDYLTADMQNLMTYHLTGN